MVLLLKQWKSRSSPGFVGGVVRNPFAMFSKAAAGQPSGGFFVLSNDPARMKRAGSPAQPSWRGVEQPGSSSGS